jgi:hypothetical protein
MWMVFERATAPSARVVHLTACLPEAESMNQVIMEPLADLKAAAKEQGLAPIC